MMMARRDSEGCLNFVYYDDSEVGDKKERSGMQMGIIWYVGADMRNQGYDFLDCL
jgi:hypothetical protein